LCGIEAGVVGSHLHQRIVAQELNRGCHIVILAGPGLVGAQLGVEVSGALASDIGHSLDGADADRAMTAGACFRDASSFRNVHSGGVHRPEIIAASRVDSGRLTFSAGRMAGDRDASNDPKYRQETDPSVLLHQYSFEQPENYLTFYTSLGSILIR
jgi:hypothetical protein